MRYIYILCLLFLGFSSGAQSIVTEILSKHDSLVKPNTTPPTGYGSFYYNKTKAQWWMVEGGVRKRAFPSTAGLSGSLTATRVPFASGASTLTDNSGFTYTAGTRTLYLANLAGTIATSYDGAGQTTVGGDYTIFNPLRISGLTNTRILFSDASNKLVDDADLTFSGSTTSMTNATVATNLTVSSLTSGRVPFATTAGLITDEAAFTYNAAVNELTSDVFVATNNMYITNKTSGRVPIFGTTGLITEDAGLTYASGSDILTLTGATGTVDISGGSAVVTITAGANNTAFQSNGQTSNNQYTVTAGTTLTTTSGTTATYTSGTTTSILSGTGNITITPATNLALNSTGAGNDISMTAADDIISSTPSFTTTLGNNALAYSADYSASYNNRSLIDRAYLETIQAGTKVKLVNIGDWNMTSANKSTAHGLSDHKQIRSVSVTIRTDDDATYDNLGRATSLGVVQGAILGWDATNINLVRTGSGSFDNTSYDATSYNRGFIYIVYVDTY